MTTQATPSRTTDASDVELLQKLAVARKALVQQIGRKIVGHQEVVENLVAAILAGGHVMIVGVPGLAKTLLVATVSEALDLQFSRVQFTPDLMPSDITGVELLEEDHATGHRIFKFVKGPIFGNVVLADEINRAPPKTQAALLQAMQERTVTVSGQTYKLPAPFFVLATQNPIEQEGTYPLPEAQLDRFLFDIRLGYPKEQDEVEILRSTTGNQAVALDAVLDARQALALQRLTREVACAEPALRYAASLARATRPDDEAATPLVKRYVRWGAGPRAGQALVLGAKANALLSGRLHVSPEDIRRVASPVLRHRVLPNFAAEGEGVGSDRIVDDVLRSVAEPKSGIKI